ncbi:30S ribosomal protein S18 [Candidatus Gottesmanbacteria bacterium]|nr:30S ribosomal protein S18 [Candidatus Gottesmanbacteria bacterium]
MMQRKFRKPRPVKTNCVFCNEKKEPDYKEWESLKKYVSERGKIIGKDRTGICAKHERKLGKTIKHARYIGLLPFIAKSF